MHGTNFEKYAVVCAIKCNGVPINTFSFAIFSQCPNTFGTAMYFAENFEYLFLKAGTRRRDLVTSEIGLLGST